MGKPVKAAPPTAIALHGDIGARMLHEHVRQCFAALATGGQAKQHIEIHLTRAQSKQLQRDSLYPLSLGYPLAYPYPDFNSAAPYRLRDYFYGVRVRVMRHAKRPVQPTTPRRRTSRWGDPLAALPDYTPPHKPSKQAIAAILDNISPRPA